MKLDTAQHVCLPLDVCMYICMYVCVASLHGVPVPPQRDHVFMCLVSCRKEGTCHPGGFIAVSFPAHCLWVRNIQKQTPVGHSLNPTVALCKRTNGVFIFQRTMSAPQHLTRPLNYCDFNQATISPSLTMAQIRHNRSRQRLDNTSL